MRHLLSSLILAILFFALPPSLAKAQNNYYNSDEAAPTAEKEEAKSEGPKNFVVTSVQKCYAQLSREDALDIQKNYLKPYQECQRRLAEKLKKEHEKKAGEAKDKDGKEQNPETAKPDKSDDHGFYRVRKGNDADDKKKKPENSTESPATDGGKN